MARPKYPSDSKRRDAARLVVSVSLPRELLAQIDQAVERCDLTRSAWLEGVVRSALKTALAPAPKPTKPTKPARAAKLATPERAPAPVKGPDLLDHLAQLARPPASAAAPIMGLTPLVLADAVAQLGSAENATELAEAWAMATCDGPTVPQRRQLRRALRERCKSLGLPLSTADEIEEDERPF